MQIITFIDKTTNCSQRKEGVRVGEYLAVTRDAFIYKVRTGRKLVSYQFQSHDKALELANFLEERYRKFLPLWDIWDDADIFRLARHSVRDGNRVARIMKNLEKR